MSDLNPSKVFESFKNNEFDKSTVVKYLQLIIEDSTHEGARIKSLKYLDKIELKSEEIFKFLENLLVSDANYLIRAAAAEIMIKRFLEKVEVVIEWVFKHEKSALCLLTIHKSLEDLGSEKARSLKRFMEESLGSWCIIEYGLIPTEALGLELLSRLLGEGNSGWELIDFKIENGFVFSLSIEGPVPPTYDVINANLFKFFSQLTELTIEGGYIDDFSDLKKLTKLRLIGSENIMLDNMDVLNGLDSIVNLKELDLSWNEINEIKGLDNLKNLTILRLTNNEIIEIKGLNNLKKLTTLNLANNKIKYITEPNLPHLYFINLAHNQIPKQRFINFYKTHSVFKYFMFAK